MIVFFDVYYEKTQAQVAAVWSATWEQAKADGYKVLQMPIPDLYKPGAFYKRELPCLLAILPHLPTEISCIVIDGYVFTGKDSWGLGAHLYEALPHKTPIIGVAKSLFKPALGVSKPLLRGESQKPLWVSSIDIDLEVAVGHIQSMHGDYRTPSLLKLVDYYSRPH